LQFIFNESFGKVFILKWVLWLRENLFISLRLPENELKVPLIEPTTEKHEPLLDELSTTTGYHKIYHSDYLLDRKSRFQSHATQVFLKEDVSKVLSLLKQNKKIAEATHNIYAYRIYDKDTEKWIEGSDDDGEITASGQVLNMMRQLNVTNVLVVVTRWFGWVLLFDDRFKHITNLAKSLIENVNLAEFKSSSK